MVCRDAQEFLAYELYVSIRLRPEEFSPFATSLYSNI